ncbi:ComF family protein [Lacticaseibacillus hulanensis]|uniref:ComF family protein n=1 Tax=Lacticaseibacillus hulanensis TaxID=2493111 RepID=UPI000FDB4D71|nr:ComF family protein [Lacticaseibacillus hulanensis]
MRWRKMDEPVLQNRGLFTYNDAMKDWIERYKGIGDYNLRDSFASDIVQFMQMRGCAFVPLTTEAGHFAERGFDPVLGLFAPLPLREWLVKDNTQMPQAKKNRAARLKTPQSFRCVATKEEMAKFDRICLLDDLYTTGRTLHHAAAAILTAGYKGKVISRSLIR